MKTVTLDHAPSLRDIAAAAGKGAVTIMDKERAVAFVLSADEFERLDQDRHIKASARARLLAIMDEAGCQARDRGLTDGELEQLLADES